MKSVIFFLSFLATIAVAEEQPAPTRVQTAVTWLSVLGVEQAALLVTAKANPGDLRVLCLSLEAWAGSTPEACVLQDGAAAQDQAARSAASTQIRETERRFLQPSILERIARVPQFDSEFLRTANYVYGVPEGAPKSTPPSILPNPDHGLLSVGGTLDFGESFPNVQSRVGACMALRDLEDTDAKSKYVLPKRDAGIALRPRVREVPPCHDWKYLAIEGFKGELERYAIATVIKVTVSQIPEFQSGVIISSPGWTYTVTGSVSPVALFTSISDRKTLVGYYVKESGAGFRNDPLPSRCGSGQLKNCLQYLTVGSTTKRVALALLPRIDVKAYSPFDLAKTASNTFLALPGGNKALYDFTLTWDLRNTIASMQMRTDALGACQDLASCRMPNGGGAGGVESGKLTEAQKAKDVKTALAKKFLELAVDPTLADHGEWWDRLRDDLATYALVRQTPAKQ